MTFVPITVLLFIVIYVMGGPAHFVNVVAQWSADFITYILNWIKHL